MDEDQKWHLAWAQLNAYKKNLRGRRMIDYDDEIHNLECPNCKKGFKKKWGEIKNSPGFRCPSCGQPLHLQFGPEPSRNVTATSASSEPPLVEAEAIPEPQEHQQQGTATSASSKDGPPKRDSIFEKKQKGR